MNDETKNMRATLLAANLRRNFAEWLRADAARLISAADFLGGEEWEGRANSVCEAIVGGAEPEEVQADLTALHRLLTLEIGGEFDGLEACHPLAVHSDDPLADDAQLCAEAIERGLRAMRLYAAATAKEVA